MWASAWTEEGLPTEAGYIGFLPPTRVLSASHRGTKCRGVDAWIYDSSHTGAIAVSDTAPTRARLGGGRARFSISGTRGGGVPGPSCCWGWEEEATL